MRTRGITLNDNLSVFQWLPSVGAGCRCLKCRGLPRETAPETAPVLDGGATSTAFVHARSSIVGALAGIHVGPTWTSCPVNGVAHIAEPPVGTVASAMSRA